MKLSGSYADVLLIGLMCAAIIYGVGKTGQYVYAQFIETQAAISSAIEKSTNK